MSCALSLYWQGEHDMNCVNDQSRVHDRTSSSFVNILYMRSTLAPIKTEQENECILVNMRDCSNDFLRDAEVFFAKSDRFQVHIRGLDYYVEVLNGDSFTEAYNKSIL